MFNPPRTVLDGPMSIPVGREGVASDHEKLATKNGCLHPFAMPPSVRVSVEMRATSASGGVRSSHSTVSSATVILSALLSATRPPCHAPSTYN